ncbi:uncharacterized protein LOC132735816 isoform X1 [Ruditapes philippinarum]|uniref:uncharacterized protein LOC132735816 isoform X1 n=1 Tax=Ruditapes philippinarum TaxID=129788 RepID=UPI00295C10C1|nr:uncharacterized protein LOC132735816 isoform X1 [Ruditapes philippinarum]
MGFSLLFSFVIVVGIYSYNFSEAREPVCSKFAYEEQLLEKMIRTEIKVETMVNEIKKTEDNVISTLGDIKQTVTDMFADMKGNITDEMLNRGDEIKRDMRGNITDEMIKRSDEIERREESFKKRFEETRNNLISGIDAKKEELIQLQESFKKRFEETRNNLTSDIDAKKEELNQIQGKLEQPPIAFYAHHVKDLALDSTNEILIFEKTFTNEGTGYDTSTGIFTAPVGGLYQFVIHTCAYKGKHAYLGLVLKRHVIAADSNYGDESYGCNTFGAIVRVKLGEKVWVKSTSSCSICQLMQDKYRMNTFSGLLVNN